MKEGGREGRLSGLPLGGWIDALAGSTPVPAGGALALATLAGAAALASKMARLRGAGPARFHELARFFLRAAEEDETSYAEALARRGGALDQCLGRGVEHLEQAVLFLEEVGTTFGDLPAHLQADVAAVAGLARASSRVLLVNLAVNASQWADEARNAPEACARIEELKGRLEKA
ncbi:MAG: hypothetical protein HY900_14910 [Deltaproteobacteria bacterium]|nr:hypothetical protein [Deltaproteobacteria bacterium]